MKTNECSNEFFMAFRNGMGSYDATCQCGRRYVSTSCDCMSSSERQLFLAEAGNSDGRLIDIGDSGVSYVNLGVEYVHGCECGAEKKYEDWIWANRDAILDYIKARTSKELKAAKENFEKCATI